MQPIFLILLLCRSVFSIPLVEPLQEVIEPLNNEVTANEKPMENEEKPKQEDDPNARSPLDGLTNLLTGGKNEKDTNKDNNNNANNNNNILSNLNPIDRIKEFFGTNEGGQGGNSNSATMFMGGFGGMLIPMNMVSQGFMNLLKMFGNFNFPKLF